MPENLNQLFQQYLRGTISPGDLKQLQQLVQDDQHSEAFHQLLEEAYTNPELKNEQSDSRAAWKEFQERLEGQSPANGKVHLFRSGWFRAAAAVLVLAAATAVWLLVTEKDKKQEVAVNGPVQQDAAPGKQGAVLQLADGSLISLDSLANGRIADANGIAVNLKDGSLSYGKATGTTVSYNTLSTPNGRQFKLVLPDGSKVWLNAASSIRYPTAFTDKQRKVEIDGEAYFEITKNEAQPFIVSKEAVDMTVLGTSFNAKLYKNEAVAAITLVTGKLQVQQQSLEKALVLNPGTQAILKDNKMSLNTTPDLNDVLAWKDGKFSFNKAGVEEVMNQLSRWYDVSIRYEGKIPVRSFTGKIPMDLQLSEVLELLSKNNILGTINGKELMVKEK